MRCKSLPRLENGTPLRVNNVWYILVFVKRSWNLTSCLHAENKIKPMETFLVNKDAYNLFFPDHMIKFCKHLRLMKTDVVMICKFISITGTRHANRPKLIFLHQQYRRNVWVNKRCLDRCIDFSWVPDLFQHIKCCPCLVSTVCFSLLLLYTAQTRKRLNFPQTRTEWIVFEI